MRSRRSPRQRPRHRRATGDASATPLSRVARGSVATLAGAAISAVVGFALTVVITRGLTKTEAGVFFSVTSAVPGRRLGRVARH